MNLVTVWPGRARIERLVLLTHQFATREDAQHVVIKWLVLVVLQSALEGFFGDDELFAIHQHFAVRHIWVDGQHQVGWQCPWRGGPSEDSRIFVHQIKLHIHTRVGHCLVGVVVHGHFGLADRSSKLRIVHQHLFAFVDFARLVQLLKGPPHALHEVLVHGAVGVRKVHPAADAIDHALPRLAICHHAFARLGDVFFQTDSRQRITILIQRCWLVATRHNLPPIHNIHLLFDEILCRQAMTVPAPAALHTLALHRPVARHCILDDATEQCPVVRHTGDERRPIIKDIGVICRSLRHRLLERLVVLPALHPVLLVFCRSAACSMCEFHWFPP